MKEENKYTASFLENLFPQTYCQFLKKIFFAKHHLGLVSEP